MKIKLVMSGRFYHAVEKLPDEIELPDGSGVSDALSRVGELLPDDATLPETCLVSVSGTHLGTVAKHRPHELSDGDELTLLTPVAGG